MTPDEIRRIELTIKIAELRLTRIKIRLLEAHHRDLKDRIKESDERLARMGGNYLAN